MDEAEGMEIAADELMLELAECDPDDEIRPALMREWALEQARSMPADSVIGGMARDDAIFVLEWARDHGTHRTAEGLRDAIRREKGDLAR